MVLLPAAAAATDAAAPDGRRSAFDVAGSLCMESSSIVTGPAVVVGCWVLGVRHSMVAVVCSVSSIVTGPVLVVSCWLGRTA